MCELILDYQVLQLLSDQQQIACMSAHPRNVFPTDGNRRLHSLEDHCSNHPQVQTEQEDAHLNSNLGS